MHSGSQEDATRSLENRAVRFSLEMHQVSLGKSLPHGDVLIKAWEGKFLNREQSGPTEEAAGAEELFRAAGLRIAVEEPESQSEDELGQEARGSGWRGQGPPMTIGRGPKTREMHDGFRPLLSRQMASRAKEVARERCVE